MSPRALRGLLVGVLLVAQLGSVALVVLGMQRDTEQTVRESAERTLVQLADRVVEQTRRWLEPADTTLRTAARLSRGGVLRTAETDAVERYLTTQLMYRPWLDGLYLGRDDGSFVMAHNTDDGLRTKRIDVDPDGARRVSFTLHDADGRAVRGWEKADDTYDPRLRPWYDVARRTDGRVGWTDPYVFFTSGRPGITAAVALTGPDGADAGVLGADIDMRELSRFVAEVPETSAGSAMIVDAAGRAVAYSDAARWDDARPDGDAPSVGAIGDAALATLFAGTGTRDASEDGVVRYLEADGVPFMGFERGFSPTGRAADDVRWSLLVQSPAIVYAGGIDALFAKGLVTLLAVLGISALLAVTAVHVTTRPLDRIHRDATVDPLTGAWNRSEFERRLGRSVAARRRRDQDELLLVVALDLDGFKAVNDELGHAAGDAILAGVVDRLRARVRERDLVGRLGGDEFALALRVDPAADFVELVERLRAGVCGEPMPTPGGPRRIGMTAGIAVHERHESVARALARADEALVAGKARAKNRSWLAPPTARPDPKLLGVRAA